MKSESSAGHVAILERLMHAASDGVDAAVVHARALDALRDALDITRASVLLFDEQGVMQFQDSRGISDRYRARVTGHSPWTPASEGATPIVVADVTTAADLAELLPVLQEERIASLAFIPLTVRGRVLGKFMLYGDEPGQFSDSDVLFATAVARYVAFAIDRRRAEQSATAGADRLRFALGAAAMGTWEWRVGTNQLDWSETLRDMHGLQPGDDDVSFERYQREIHPDDRERVLTALERSLSGGAGHHIEYRIVLADGSVKWVEGKGRVLRDESGAPVRMIGICMDITDRKRAEADREKLLEQIEAARQRADFRAKVTGALAAVSDYDVTLNHIARLMVPFFADWCTIDLVDDAGDLRRGAAAHSDPVDEAKLLELRERYATVGRSLPTLSILTDGKPIVTDVSDDALRTASVSDDYYERAKDLAPASTIVTPLRTSNRVIGVMSLVFAKSGRRYTDADLPLAADLAHAAAIAIDNARLFRELQDANRMKDEFLMTLSHELRTPLNAILGWSSIVAARPTDDPLMAKALEAIDRNARAQTKLISDLLDVSRIVSGKLRLARASVDLRKVIESAVDAVRVSCASKRIAVSLSVQAELPRIVGDPDRLQQIIWNLLSNAVKFTPEDGRIALDAHFDGSAVEVSVSDNGCGIAPDFLPHVFDRFRQADASSTRAHSGLGLGLAIARQLTELHGGTVRASSAGVGKGATFALRFPAGTAAMVEEPEPLKEPVAETDKLRGIEVLVVDDDRDAREFVQTCLQRSGARVHVAGSVSDAAIHLQRAIDLLITDIAMPEQDGYALLAQARAAKPSLPAIAFTAYAMPDDQKQMALAGFDRHLAKPAEAVGLLAVVTELVKMRPAG
ncbi:MAG TPA: ATP-binding protein [Vicinamibacterales bacterium]|nr:ATP-binding protein [Vicinamibacterales bacterium]